MTLINSRVAGSGRPPAPVNDSLEVAIVPLKKYEVTLPGGRTTVMKLNEADAERYGATAVSGGRASTVEADDNKPAVKKRTASNKARTAADKAGGAGGGDD